MTDGNDIPRSDIPRDDAMEPELHAFAERVASGLRGPERVDAGFEAKLLAAIAQETPPWAAGAATRQAPVATPAVPATTIAPSPVIGEIPRRAGGWRRALEPRTFRLSPLGGLAAAAAFAGIVALGTVQTMLSRGTIRATDTVAMVAGATPDTVHVVQFVLVAPRAARVSVVGDFNDWRVDATPLRPVRGGGVWMVSLPLPEGRHEYSFVVDGQTWVADPSAPVAVESDFGAPSSVVTVGEVQS